MSSIPIVSKIMEISPVIKVLVFHEFSRILRKYFGKPKIYFVRLIKTDINPQTRGYIC